MRIRELIESNNLCKECGNPSWKTLNMSEQQIEGWFGFGEGKPIEAPEWLNDENKALWQQKQPTDKDKIFVQRLAYIETMLKRTFDYNSANQSVAGELTNIQREGVEEGEQHGNSKIYKKCWKGYRKVPGKTAGSKGSCKKA